MKENNIQKAVRQRNEIIDIIGKCFLDDVEGEDNSWRCTHNLIQLELQAEILLFNYFKNL